MTDRDKPLPVLRPDTQVSFYYRLQGMKTQYLHEALKAAVDSIGQRLPELDDELAQYVRPEILARVASFGLRGEVVFPVPMLLRQEPYLLGYYRLLYGLSQKEFYSAGPFGPFSAMEDRGEIPARVAPELGRLCKSLAQTGEALIEGTDGLSLRDVHDLQLLTIGPFLRGSENTRIGQKAMQEVYDLLHEVVGDHVRSATNRTITVENASGRAVLIEFRSDPDVRIEEVMESGSRPLVSMEVKGGADHSNVHNRLGEAEKSHQKARGKGFFEFWTILRCDISNAEAKRESPTTSHFFQMDELVKEHSEQRKQFRDLLCSIIGIPTR